jgi:hypothetical protein
MISRSSLDFVLLSKRRYQYGQLYGTVARDFSPLIFSSKALDLNTKRFKNRFEDDPVLWLLREFDQSSDVATDHTASEGQLGNDPAGGGGAGRGTRFRTKAEFLGEFEVVFETAEVFWTGKTSVKKKKENVLGHSPCKHCMLCIT